MEYRSIESIKLVRKNQIILFTLLMCLSIILVVLAFFWGGGALFEKEDSAFHTNQQKAACITLLRRQGFHPSMEANNTIEIHNPSEENREEVLTRAGMAIFSCPTYNVLKFCVGGECEKTGVSFTLKPM